MLESFGYGNFSYDKLTEEEQEKRGILGRLAGVLADTKNPTRNGRKYKKSLWEKVFNDPINKEKIANKCFFGELGHPEDRLEVDMEKIAICLAEQPKLGDDGKLYGVFDILATPNGKILKTLCDYGCKIGVSSRGEGDVITDIDGEEIVDEDTYNCSCWDAVLIPSVKDARPVLVNESLSNKKTLTESLNDIINSAKESDKKIMKDTINALNLNENLGENIVYNNNNNPQKEVYYINEDQKTSAVENIKAKESNDLQEALVKINDLESDNLKLQERLSVCYAKDRENASRLISMKKSIIKLTENLKQEQAKEITIKKLKTQLIESKNQLIENRKEVSKVNRLLEKYKDRINEIESTKKSLNESISNEASKSKKLMEQMSSMEDTFNLEKKSLNEEIHSLRRDLELTKGSYSKKLDKSKIIIEKYKNIAQSAVDKYIESKATVLGVSINEIKNRLNESYTFDDIDNVCNDLKSYKINMNKLPFNFSKSLNESSKIKVNSSSLDKTNISNSDDELDSQLLALSGLE